MLTRLLALAIVLSAPAVCRGQEGPTYVGASVMVSTQDSHRQGSAPSLPTSGAGGTAIGATFEAGRMLTARIAVGAELSLPTRFTALQETDYIRVFQQESRHRDLVLSGIVREVVVPTARVQVGFVEGVGLVQERYTPAAARSGDAVADFSSSVWSVLRRILVFAMDAWSLRRWRRRNCPHAAPGARTWNTHSFREA